MYFSHQQKGDRGKRQRIWSKWPPINNRVVTIWRMSPETPTGVTTLSLWHTIYGSYLFFTLIHRTIGISTNEIPSGIFQFWCQIRARSSTELLICKLPFAAPNWYVSSENPFYSYCIQTSCLNRYIVKKYRRSYILYWNKKAKSILYPITTSLIIS